MATKKRGLGRNLNALLGNSLQKHETAADRPGQLQVKDRDMREIPVEMVQRGKYQPRRDMHPEALEELAESIKAQGVMQPIIVRSISADKFEIIAGERRWRATQLAGLDTIPALIREVPDEAAVAMALIENIQREDLNAMEEALALSRLQEEFGLTHQQVAEAVGKSRATVTNLLRLINLRADVQKLLENGDIDMGHAKALLGLPPDQQSSVAGTVVSKGLSVRQTEALVRRLLETKETAGKARFTSVDPDIKNLETRLSEQVGVPVIVQHGANGKGKLVLKYNNLDELDGILSHIK